MTATELSYVIDADDVLVEASPGYFEFAADGHWHGSQASLGQPLWLFVAGAPMRKVQRALVRRVRDHGRTIELPFRCDGPEVRREMEIRIGPRAEGRVAFAARLLSERRRQPQALLDPDARRGSGEIEMCGWCNRFLVGGEWVEVEAAAAELGLTGAAAVPAISHVICPDCKRMLTTV